MIRNSVFCVYEQDPVINWLILCLANFLYLKVSDTCVENNDGFVTYNTYQESATQTRVALSAERSTSAACCGAVRTVPDVTSALFATVTTNTTFDIVFCVSIITNVKGMFYI